jgi:hypothetical protein
VQIKIDIIGKKKIENFQNFEENERTLASMSNKKENQKRRGALTYRPEGKQPSAWDLSQSGGSSNLRQNDGWHGCYYVKRVWYFCPFVTPNQRRAKAKIRVSETAPNWSFCKNASFQLF